MRGDSKWTVTSVKAAPSASTLQRAYDSGSAPAATRACTTAQSRSGQRLATAYSRCAKTYGKPNSGPFGS